MKEDDNHGARSAGTPPLAERVLMVGGVVAAAALTTPLLPQVWSGSPSLFGLPRSIVWVVCVLLSVFGLLLWSHWSDAEQGRPESESD